jgi:pyrimidine-nucleoside phosphorylase
MAIAIRGLSPEELSHWTDAMLHSGRVLDLSSIKGTKVDKHSTGGVGDKISICLAPLVAACGVPVPMISGRGLGHTGGTLDKLEAIPSFDVRLSTEQFIDLVESVGLCLIGQTEDLAPADRKIYSLRDVTATVESIPLIASSIMSKKLAEGIDALVLDVKVGRGAFMKTEEDARSLAETLIGIGVRAKKKVTAFLTDMEGVLGYTVGNALETQEALDVLRGQGPTDVTELTLRLGAEMLILGDLADDEGQARELLDEAISSGKALEKMKTLIDAQGGDPRVVDNGGVFPQASKSVSIKAPRGGFVLAQDSLGVARAAMLVGAGRRRAEDSIDPAVGVTLKAKRGHEVTQGQPLAVLHHNEKGAVDEALSALSQAFEIGDHPPEERPLIIDVMKGKNL